MLKNKAAEKERLETFKGMHYFLRHLGFLEERIGKVSEAILINGCGEITVEGGNYIMEASLENEIPKSFTISKRDCDHTEARDFFDAIVKDGFAAECIATWAYAELEFADSRVARVNFEEIRKERLDEPIDFCSTHLKKLDYKYKFDYSKEAKADSVKSAETKIMYRPKKRLFGVEMRAYDAMDKIAELESMYGRKMLEVKGKDVLLEKYIDVLTNSIGA